ncbi:pyruvate, phosphate dikinase, partial [bacterium]|nr:pyruvate, phosphate dikinase [bacterium]
MPTKTKPSKPKKPLFRKSVKYVYSFGSGKADGNGKMKALLGGKGANLAEMTRIRLPVPAGFTISTDVCTYFYENQSTYPPSLERQIDEAIAKIEHSMGKKLGDPVNPLLLAVRSGARDSMPGMMDTILNLGLNDKTVRALAERSRNERFAYDCYRRFLQMYGDVVMGVQKRPGEDHDPFEVVIENLKKELHPKDPHIADTKLDASALRTLTDRFRKLIRERTGKDFPDDPREQLRGSVGAVFGSWNNDRAIVYRRKYNIPHEWGTAVNVQAMVFGNTGNDSGSGVSFTRDPATGEKVLYGEFLLNAQGEDVVAGVRTPEPVAQLQVEMPEVFRQLQDVRHTLEGHFHDMQDFEFTVEQGRLFMLQTRNGKRTGFAAVRIAVEMVKEKLIQPDDAIRRIPADSLSQLLAPVFEAKARKTTEVIARGLPAGPGAASGQIYFQANDAEAAAQKGLKVLLVRIETSPEDIRGMLAAEGILTARGGVSSHAALVARQMGKVCVCGASDLHIDYAKATLTVRGKTFNKGDFLSIDGTTGEIFPGEVKTSPSDIVRVLIDKDMTAAESPIYRVFAQLMQWADQRRKLEVRANADQPDQVGHAIAFGAQGVGLCRTEHMFFEGDR